MSPSDRDRAVASHLLRFFGKSRAAVAVRKKIADFLARHGTEHPPPPILLRGEVGVGKSLLARLIHRAGPRPEGPFVEFNCAIPAEFLESELYGYERDTRRAKPGAFQAANHGTLFLDHMTELPEESQAQLLKVLEERSVRQLRSTRDEPLDVWILTATYEDLRAAVHYHRSFREVFNLHETFFIENLYQHLGQLDILIPPLRQRPDDILLLAEHFLAHVCAEHHLPPKSFAPDARRALLADDWPGNVRQVKHLIGRVALRFTEKGIITTAMLVLAMEESTHPLPPKNDR